ncbi:phage virion morphogenesis protein [Roseinatronobacter sp. NSM]|uniref:phage virion morphogenesis protein n=1 Tax=Roseinatronobacter sp. NSM TaxID=3457785 RepID=UPI0040373116
MAGVQVELTLQGIEGAARALGQLATTDLEDLAYNVGALLESSTKERIATEKAAPDGTPWTDWSAHHAATRKTQHSLLVQDNDLLNATQNYTTGTTVRVGNNLVYGAIHQLGGEITNAFGRGIKVTMPARPYLGISSADAVAITALVTESLSEPFQ